MLITHFIKEHCGELLEELQTLIIQLFILAAKNDTYVPCLKNMDLKMAFSENAKYQRDYLFVRNEAFYSIAEIKQMVKDRKLGLAKPGSGKNGAFTKRDYYKAIEHDIDKKKKEWNM